LEERKKQEKLYLYQILKEQERLFESQINYASQETSEILNTEGVIEEMKSAGEVLPSIGSGVYLFKKGRLLVDIGAGIFIGKSMDKVVDTLEFRRKGLQESVKELRENLEKIKEEIRKLEPEIKEMLKKE